MGDAGFNEAAAFLPRMMSGATSAMVRLPSLRFNEAAAFLPRMISYAIFGLVLKAERFNEAAAFLPRMMSLTSTLMALELARLQ